MNPWEVVVLVEHGAIDTLRKAELDRLARKTAQGRERVDLRCWLSSRLYYIGALVDHRVRRIRHVLPAGEAAPALADCR